MSARVLAGSPCGKVPACDRFYDCFSGLVLPEGSPIRQRVVGGSVPGNLNKLVNLAIDAKATHLFIVEDDSVFQPDTVMRLLAHDKPVVTGLCRARHAPFYPYIYKDITDAGYVLQSLGPNDSGLVKCAATGLGGILINMDVFAQMKRPYFHHYFIGEREWGQDIVFGKALVDMGVEVYCDTDVIIGHITQCTLGSERDAEGWKITVVIDQAAVNLPQPVEGK